MRGLDPRIHLLKMRLARWIAGSRLRQKASPGTDCCGRRSFSEAGKPGNDDILDGAHRANLIHISNSDEDARPHPRGTSCPSLA